MSLILTGVNLPKKGEALSLFMMADGQVIITHIKDSRIWEYSEAKAIQIPKNHGRIGDLDGVIKQIDKSPTFASKYKGTAKLFIDVYSDNNTILEAEE